MAAMLGLAGKMTAGEMAGLAARAQGSSPFNGSGMLKSFGNGTVPEISASAGDIAGSLIGKAGKGGGGGRAAGGASDMSQWAFDAKNGGFVNYINSQQANPGELQALFQLSQQAANNQPQRQPINSLHSLYLQNMMRGAYR